jgi:hypothetical protein
MPEDEGTDWKALAVHALYDLTVLGVKIEEIPIITQEAVDAVDDYERTMTGGYT